jgi:hypothetical protein
MLDESCRRENRAEAFSLNPATNSSIASPLEWQTTVTA